MAYETNQAPFIPTPDEVNAAYADVIDHNQNTGLAGAFRSVVNALMELGNDLDSPGLSEESLETNAGSSVVEGDMNADLQGVFHEDLFTRIGLELVPLGNHFNAADGNEKRITSNGLEPAISNTELYTGFLRTLQPEDVQDLKMPLTGDVVYRLLGTVWNSFDTKTRSQIPDDLQPLAQDIGENALRTFAAIGSEYRRLGIDATGLRLRHDQEPEGIGWISLSKDADPKDKADMIAHRIYNKSNENAGFYETLETWLDNYESGLPVVPPLKIPEGSIENYGDR